METKLTNEKTNWKSLEVVTEFIKTVSSPIRANEIIDKMRSIYPSFSSYAIYSIEKELNKCLGSIREDFIRDEDKSITGPRSFRFFIKDTDVAIELYTDYINSLDAAKKVSKLADTDPQKRGAKSGYRKETYRNLLTIVDIINSTNNGYIKEDELISKYKKLTNQVSFNKTKLDEYSNIMSELGIPFDYKRAGRIGLIEPRCNVLLKTKYNEAPGKTLGDVSRLQEMKKLDRFQVELNKLSKEDRKSTILKLSKLLYLYKGKFGIKFSEIPEVYNKTYNKQISTELTMSIIADLRKNLPTEDLKIFEDSIKITNWESVLRVYDPTDLFKRLVIKLPNHIDITKYFGTGSSNVIVADSNNEFTYYEVTTMNNEILTRTLLNIRVSGGKILFPHEISNNIDGILSKYIDNIDIML